MRYLEFEVTFCAFVYSSVNCANISWKRINISKDRKKLILKYKL